MKDYRSSSQVIFGFLPEQTVDLKGKIWKVKHWRMPFRLSGVDTEILREGILMRAIEWERNNKDYKNFLSLLRKGVLVEAYALDDENGVEVNEFPNQWICNTCKQFHDQYEVQCGCGSTKKGQIPFVAYHECGVLKEITIPKCPKHKQAKIQLPKAASLADIIFCCDKCEWKVRGIPYMNCTCGEKMSINIHRAAKVYTPRSVVIVNPPVRGAREKLQNAGGNVRAVNWLINGMKERSVDKVSTSKSSVAETLLKQGIPEETVKEMISKLGENYDDDSDLKLPIQLKSSFEQQAGTIGLATLESRITVDDLCESAGHLGIGDELYKNNYREAFVAGGLWSIDLLERFPIFTGHFGYTRDGFLPGESTLRPFKHHDRRQSKIMPVYGDLAETEALLVRLNPITVLKWLKEKGYDCPSHPATFKDAYLAIIALFADTSQGEHARKDVLTLIHSYSHRFIRSLAVYAGIDRNGIAEMILELGLSFIVYSVPRGDFVLGGMHAVFEQELHTLMHAVVSSEHRCALDPGCEKNKAACMACLHLGEPSCALFNRSLSRKSLFGDAGYFNVKT